MIGTPRCLHRIVRGWRLRWDEKRSIHYHQVDLVNWCLLDVFDWLDGLGMTKQVPDQFQWLDTQPYKFYRTKSRPDWINIWLETNST